MVLPAVCSGSAIASVGQWIQVGSSTTDVNGNYNGQIVSGAALSGTGSVSIVTTGGDHAGTFLVTQTTSGVGVVLPVNPLANAKGSRLTWIQRR